MVGDENAVNVEPYITVGNIKILNQISTAENFVEMFDIIGEMHRQILFIYAVTSAQPKHYVLVEKVVFGKDFTLGVMAVFGDLSLIISEFALVPTAAAVVI